MKRWDSPVGYMDERSGGDYVDYDDHLAAVDIDKHFDWLRARAEGRGDV